MHKITTKYELFYAKRGNGNINCSETGTIVSFIMERFSISTVRQFHFVNTIKCLSGMYGKKYVSRVLLFG